MDLMEIRRRMMQIMAQGSGAEYVSGSFTCPSSGSSYELSFGKTFTKYLLFIEATDGAKTSIMSSGQSGARSYAIWGSYPKLSIGNTESAITTLLNRVNPSTSATDVGKTTGFTYTGSSVTCPMGALTSGANYVYRDLTYNYYIVEIK